MENAHPEPHRYVLPVVREVVEDRRVPAEPPDAAVEQRRLVAASLLRCPSRD
jgi:hypothetical protein